MKKFDVVFLEEVELFLDGIEPKAREKIIYNVAKATFHNDPELFKKLNDIVWEFRTRYGRNHYRLLAFWDKRDGQNILVIATHAFVKKSQKIPGREVDKTERIAKRYLAE